MTDKSQLSGVAQQISDCDELTQESLAKATKGKAGKPGGGKMDYCWLVWSHSWNANVAPELKWLRRTPLVSPQAQNSEAS